jgi:hypothetical protein
MRGRQPFELVQYGWRGLWGIRADKSSQINIQGPMPWRRNRQAMPSILDTKQMFFQPNSRGKQLHQQSIPKPGTFTIGFAQEVPGKSQCTGHFAAFRREHESNQYSVKSS